MASRQEMYEEIAKIALEALGPITLEVLSQMLGRANNRGTASMLRGAFNYHKNKSDHFTAGKVAGTFTDSNGNYLYQKQK
ncbi:hypothetical protein LJB91_01920 [Bacteroidales bacterium OttesenSCG-928-L03]|nr:hypothetical protein [Bacteroidales bacterium OttesenSCG-928-L03]